MKNVYPRYQVSVSVIMLGAPDISQTAVQESIHKICEQAIYKEIRPNKVMIETISTSVRIIDGLKGEA